MLKEWTRSTERAQTSAERKFFPDPDRDPDSDADRHHNEISWSIGHISALRKISSKPVGNSIQWIRISDFGLLDPDCDPDRHQNWTHWSLSHALPLQEISSKSVHNFFSYPTDRQTNRHTDWQTDGSENITSFGGVNEYCLLFSVHILMPRQ